MGNAITNEDDESPMQTQQSEKNPESKAQFFQGFLTGLQQS